MAQGCGYQQLLEAERAQKVWGDTQHPHLALVITPGTGALSCNFLHIMSLGPLNNTMKQQGKEGLS